MMPASVTCGGSDVPSRMQATCWRGALCTFTGARGARHGAPSSSCSNKEDLPHGPRELLCVATVLTPHRSQMYALIVQFNGLQQHSFQQLHGNGEPSLDSYLGMPGSTSTGTLWNPPDTEDHEGMCYDNSCA